MSSLLLALRVIYPPISMFGCFFMVTNMVTNSMPDLAVFGKSAWMLALLVFFLRCLRSHRDCQLIIRG